MHCQSAKKMAKRSYPVPWTESKTLFKLYILFSNFCKVCGPCLALLQKISNCYNEKYVHVCHAALVGGGGGSDDW